MTRQHRMLAIAWWLSLTLNGLLIQWLKPVLERVRPAQLHDLALTHSRSFPTGHSRAAVQAHGCLALMALWLLPPRGTGRWWAPW